MGVLTRSRDKSYWETKNLILGAFEVGFEYDTGKSKIGNGTSRWNDLPYSDYAAFVIPEPVPTSDVTPEVVEANLPERLSDESLNAAFAAQITPQFNQAGTTYSLALTDAGSVVQFSAATAITLTVPLNSTTAFVIGTTIVLRQYGAGQVTITPATGVTLRSRGGVTKIAGQYAEVTLTKCAIDEWILTGDLA